MRVLLDTFNTALPERTGIATYARNLADGNKRLGNDVYLLTAADIPFERRNGRRGRRALAAPDATLVFDSPESPNTYAKLIRHEIPWIVRNRLYSIRKLTGGIFSSEIPIHLVSGLEVLDPKPIEDQFGKFDGVLNGRRVYDRAFRYFRQTGELLSIDLPVGVDIAHFSWSIPLHVRNAVNVYTIHDLMPFTLSQMVRENKSQIFEIIAEICRRADLVVTVSEYSKEQLKAIFGIDESRVVNTYQSIKNAAPHRKWDDTEIASALDATFSLKPRQYFLFCGSIEPRKNVSRLIEAYFASGSGYPLVICGPRGQSAETELRFADLPTQIREAGIARGRRSSKVVVLEYVPREVLRLLMTGARALVCPSISEGFGLPALEAMSVGTPVIASNAGALPEICGEAAIYVNPYDVSDICRAIAEISNLSDEALDASGRRSVFQVGKFSAERYDRKLSAAYASAIGTQRIS